MQKFAVLFWKCAKRTSCPSSTRRFRESFGLHCMRVEASPPPAGPLPRADPGLKVGVHSTSHRPPGSGGENQKNLTRFISCVHHSPPEAQCALFSWLKLFILSAGERNCEGTRGGPRAPDQDPKTRQFPPIHCTLVFPWGLPAGLDPVLEPLGAASYPESQIRYRDHSRISATKEHLVRREDASIEACSSCSRRLPSGRIYSDT